VAKSLAKEIKELKYVYQAMIIGNYDRVLKISLNHKKIEAYGLDRYSVLKKIDELFLVYPIGKIKSDKEQYFINTRTTELDREKIENLRIKIDEKLLHVGDIAEVDYYHEKHSMSTRTNADKSIIIMVKKAQKGDSLKLSQEIREILVKYQRENSSLSLKILSDSSFWIKTRLNVISSNIIIGLILLFFAIWFFVSFRISLVVLVGIPVSLAFGVIGLDFFGGGLNTLSLLGVLLSLGFLVDEAIVVSENIHRHRLLGKSIKEACVDGTYEVIPTLFIALLTTIIAFIPLMFISGGLGIFIKIIPVMVVVLIVSSFIESFVFLPLHYNLLMREEDKHKHSLRELLWEKLGAFYKRILRVCISYKYSFVAVLVVLALSLSVVMIKNSEFTLFPEFDAMSIQITGEVKHNSLTYTSRAIKPIEEILLKNLDPQEFSSIHATIGMKSGGRGSHEKGNNFFTIVVNLKPKIADNYFNREINPYFQLFGSSTDEPISRKSTAKEIRENLETWLKDYKKTMNLNMNIPQTGVVQSDIFISFTHDSDEKIKKSIDLLKQKMTTIDGIHNIKDDMRYDDIILELDINSYGRELGFTQKSLITQLRGYLKAEKISKITNVEGEQIDLKVAISQKDRVENFESLLISVPNRDTKVRLNEIAQISYIKKLTSIKKDNLNRVFSVSASMDKERVSTGRFYREIAPALKEIRGSGVEIILKGEAGKNEDIKRDMTKSFIITLFGILMVLTWFFNSLKLSLFSLSVIPLSLFGVLVGHSLLGLSLAFSSLLGFVGLVGIVMNDTLLMLNFIKKSKTKEELIEFASHRLRPVLLTSITTVLGLSTLIFFASGESLLMQPLAVSIGFGLLGATMINLFYIPVAFTFWQKKYW
jgi:multidrug efflux pump subunit AcrB